uniref:Uncharacterized protein n=1 Tax=Arundo donax TaxID=35708 RepID=A0A0A9G8I2_ARUDO
MLAVDRLRLLVERRPRAIDQEHAVVTTWRCGSRRTLILLFGLSARAEALPMPDMASACTEYDGRSGLKTRYMTLARAARTASVRTVYAYQAV